MVGWLSFKMVGWSVLQQSSIVKQTMVSLYVHKRYNMIFDSKIGGGGVVCAVVLSLLLCSCIAQQQQHRVILYGQSSRLVGGAAEKDRGERMLPRDVAFGN